LTFFRNECLSKKGLPFLRGALDAQCSLEVSPGHMPSAPSNLPLKNGGRLGAISRSWSFHWHPWKFFCRRPWSWGPLIYQIYDEQIKRAMFIETYTMQAASIKRHLFWAMGAVF